MWHVEESSMKLAKTILKFAGIALAAAGLVMAVVGFWEDICACFAKCRACCEEAEDFAD